LTYSYASSDGDNDGAESESGGDENGGGDDSPDNSDDSGSIDNEGGSDDSEDSDVNIGLDEDQVQDDSEEICDNGIDDNGDGLTDGQDALTCPDENEEICDNGIDDNNDGLTDKDDLAACSDEVEDVDGQDRDTSEPSGLGGLFSPLVNDKVGGGQTLFEGENEQPLSEETELLTVAGEVCDDGFDNDGDTFVDIADDQCAGPQTQALATTGATPTPIPSTSNTPTPAPAPGSMTYKEWHDYCIGFAGSGGCPVPPPCNLPPSDYDITLNYDDNCPEEYQRWLQQKQQPQQPGQPPPPPPNLQPLSQPPADQSSLPTPTPTPTPIPAPNLQPLSQPPADLRSLPTLPTIAVKPDGFWQGVLVGLVDGISPIPILDVELPGPENFGGEGFLLTQTLMSALDAKSAIKSLGKSFARNADDLAGAAIDASSSTVKATAGSGDDLVKGISHSGDDVVDASKGSRGVDASPSDVGNTPPRGSSSGEVPPSGDSGGGGSGGGGGDTTPPAGSSGGGSGNGGSGSGGGGNTPPDGTPPTPLTPPIPPIPPTPTAPLTSNVGSTHVPYTQPTTERVMQLAPDPHKGGFRPDGSLPLNSQYEGTVGAIIEDKFGGLQRAPATFTPAGKSLPGPDFISQSGPLKGQSFDLVGVAPSQVGFVKMEGKKGLLSAISEHVDDPKWNTIVDMSNFNSAQKAMIRDHISKLPEAAQQRIFVVEIAGGSPPLLPLPSGSNSP
jgi:hypothetical protein